MGNLQSLLLRSVDMFFEVIYFLIIVRIIMSWIAPNGGGVIGALVFRLTEPILGPIRSMIDRSPIGGGMILDFTPVIALFALNVLKMIFFALIQLL